jgi:putative heme-binding domain-containing protein
MLPLCIPGHRRAFVSFLTGCLALASAWAQVKKLTESGTNPLTNDRNAVEAGGKLYAQNCAPCHGALAQGGRAPKLADSAHIHEMDDLRIFDVLRHGVPNTEMIASDLPDLRLWEMIAFVRSLNTVARDQHLTGDPANGKSLFFGRLGCNRCHMISGRGGLVGPDLFDIADRQSAEKIKQSILFPNAYINPDYAHVLVIASSGRVEGLVKNESNYSIQIQDLQGNLHSLLKSEVQEIVRYSDSLMPKVPLSDEQLQDVLAFLSTQSRDATVPDPPASGKDREPPL